MRRGLGIGRIGAFAGWLLAAGATAWAGPDVRLENRETVVLRIRALTAVPAGDRTDPDYRMELEDDQEARTRLLLSWPAVGDRTQVDLRATRRPPRPGVANIIRLDAEVELPDGRRVAATRDLSVEETATALFEVHRAGGRVLTLAVEAEVMRETVLSAKPTAGVPVLLMLEIQRVLIGRAISLETNRLSTFVGDGVTYSFRLGEGADAESARVKLTPLRLYGDVAEIQVELSGKVPDGDGVRLVSRTERWLTNRGATSSLTIESGRPPTGYRFLVTPLF